MGVGQNTWVLCLSIFTGADPEYGPARAGQTSISAGPDPQVG